MDEAAPAVVIAALRAFPTSRGTPLGASNVAAAYALYAGKVPPLSMQLLAFMALVSRDGDSVPWYGQGHAALADGAMGRQRPITETDVRAVRRAVEPLLRAGAISVDRRPSPRADGPYRTVRYRLHLNVLPGLELPTVDKPGDNPGDNRKGWTAADGNPF